MWHRGVFLTGDIIREKARRLQRALNHTFLPHEQLKGTFSQGWLHKFNKRHNFKSHKSHGEEGDADDEGAATAPPALKELAAQYLPCDIFNADEFGLNYNATPTRTTGPAPLKGRKQSK